MTTTFATWLKGTATLLPVADNVILADPSSDGTQLSVTGFTEFLNTVGDAETDPRYEAIRGGRLSAHTSALDRLKSMVDIADFVPHAPVPAEIIDEYRGRVPDELVEIWEQYGYGTFGEGFLRVIDPKRYEAEVGDYIGRTQGDGIAIPIMVTGLGDLITWEPSAGVIGILYREVRTVGLNSTVDNFVFMVGLDGADGLSDTLNWDLFPEAVEAHGELPYDQSFIFVLLPSLGDTAKVENLRMRETIASIRVAVEMQGVIGH